MKRHLLAAFLPPALLAAILCLLLLVPMRPELQPAAISADLPVNYSLNGWHGVRTQESNDEREALAADTRFSKAAYLKLRHSADEPRGPMLTVSIVFSGNDMNASIHRPERCLPAQGHIGLHGSNVALELANGRSVTFRRLVSHTPPKNGQAGLRHINYYVFIGADSLHHSHFSRTFKDMYDRVAKGRTQRWAYFQAGAYWGGPSGVSEQLAESQLRALISQLLPSLINWEAIGG